MEKAVKYLIWSPNYDHKSGGVRALHKFCHLLNESGCEAYITGNPNPEWNEKLYTGLADEDNPIVVYPEIVPGNPLNARKVVRWVLNTPGYLAGEVHYHPSELLFTWDRRFLDLPKDRILKVKNIEDGLFVNKGGKRTMDCFWMGKGLKRSPYLAFTDGMLEITAEWPQQRTELAKLFNKVKTFYTYDDCTQLSLEASLCGCKVVLLPENNPVDLGNNIAVNDSLIPPKEFERMLNNFIRITQEWAKPTL
jgi:hypothetical protein